LQEILKLPIQATRDMPRYLVFFSLTNIQEINLTVQLVLESLENFEVQVYSLKIA